jgi:streptogramin lyase
VSVTLEPATTVVELPTVPDPVRIAVPALPDTFASDGTNLWLTAEGAGSVVSIDPASGDPVGSFSVGSNPKGIDFGEGALWVTRPQARKVLRIDLETGTTTEIPVAGRPLDVTVGPSGVWVTMARSGVARIDPVAPHDVEYVDPRFPVFGLLASDDEVWVSRRVDVEDHYNYPGTVVRIDPETLALSDSIPVGLGPAELELADGVLWVANRGGHTVSRIDLSADVDGHYETTEYVACTMPVDIYAEDDKVWVLCAGPVAADRVTPIGPGKLILMDADTGDVLDDVQIPGRPESLFPFNGSLWVAVRAGDQVWRFDLGTEDEDAAPAASTSSGAVSTGSAATVPPPAPG